MSAFITSPLETVLKDIGFQSDSFEELRNTGSLLLERESSPSLLLTLSENGDIVILVCHLCDLPSQNVAAMLAYALQLNLNPEITRAAAIALDVANSQLCLRYNHPLRDNPNSQMFLNVLNNVSALGQQLSEHLKAHQSDENETA